MTSHLTLRAGDDPTGYARTTRMLVASLAARLGTLGQVTAGEAVGSQLAGIAALGQRVSASAEGGRLRAALEAGRAGQNGESIWRAMHIDEWLAGMPPSPVLDELRNDLALLVAEDLTEALVPGPDSATVPTAPVPMPASVSFLDVMVGLWAWGRELTAAVEAAAADAPLDRVVGAQRSTRGPLSGPILR